MTVAPCGVSTVRDSGEPSGGMAMRCVLTGGGYTGVNPCKTSRSCTPGLCAQCMKIDYPHEKRRPKMREHLNQKSLDRPTSPTSRYNGLQAFPFCTSCADIKDKLGAVPASVQKRTWAGRGC